MNTPPTVSAQEWQAARERLRVKEKQTMRARDALTAERRRMPWLAVEKDYRFEGPDGPASLLDLFAGRRQLLLYRAFYEPGVAGWPEHGCVGCSFMADHVPHLQHLNARDTTLVYALGRQEQWEDSPEGYPQTPPYAWWKWHDAYDSEPSQEHLEQTARALATRERGDR